MNITRKTLALCFAASTLLISINAKGQATGEGAEQTVIKFANAYEKLPQSKDINSVLSLVSKDLFSTIINSSVADNFGLIKSTYHDFEGYVTSLTRQSDVDIKYDINDILKTNFRGKSAVVVADISYQYNKGNTLLRKGTEATTFVLRYTKKGWKIINFNVVNLEEELNVGQCVAEVFLASTGNYMTKTTVPAGASYESNVDEFIINKGQNGVHFISVSGNDYTWIREGNITKTDNGSETMIGEAVDELEAVLTILENDLYDKQCSDFRRKR